MSASKPTQHNSIGIGNFSSFSSRVSSNKGAAMEPLAKVVDWVSSIANLNDLVSGLNTRIQEIGENTPDAISLRDDIASHESRISKLKEAISLEARVHPEKQNFGQLVSDAISNIHSDKSSHTPGSLTDVGHRLQTTWQNIISSGPSPGEPAFKTNIVDDTLKGVERATFLADKSAAKAPKTNSSGWSFAVIKEEAKRRIHNNFSNETNFILPWIRFSGAATGLGMMYNGVQNLAAYGSLNKTSFPEEQKPMVNSQKSHLLFMGATNVALGAAIAGASIFMEFPTLKNGGRGGIV